MAYMKIHLFYALVVVLNGRYSSSVELPVVSSGIRGDGYAVYSCPLRSSMGILSSKYGKDCSESSKRDIPYGPRHTFLQIGNMCYDWGDWNYPRQLSCSDPDLDCCVRFRRFENGGVTYCADRISDFERAWILQGKSYTLYSWNCQVYTNHMVDFLSHCYLSHEISSIFG